MLDTDLHQNVAKDKQMTIQTQVPRSGQNNKMKESTDRSEGDKKQQLFSWSAHTESHSVPYTLHSVHLQILKPKYIW